MPSDSPPLAIVRNLLNQVTGPPHHLSESVVPVDTQQLLFGDYLTYAEGSLRFIFVSSIIAKYLTLFSDNWNVLTLPVNEEL